MVDINLSNAFHGLASPPESRFNSPMFPFGSSSSFQNGNPSPSRCVDPRDLHSHAEPSPAASQVEKQALISLQDGDLSLGSSSRSQNRNPSPSQCVNPENHHDGTQPLPPATQIRNPVAISLEEDKNDEDATMSGVPLSGEDDPSMVGIESGKQLMGCREDDLFFGSSSPFQNGNPLLSRCVNPENHHDGTKPVPPASQIVKPAAISLENDKNDEDATMSGVHTIESSSRPQEGDSFISIMGAGKPSEALSGSADSPMVGVESGKPADGVDFYKPSQMEKMDFEYSAKLAAEFEPRRSARNIAANNRPTVNYADYVPLKKSATSKKKPAFEKDEDILQARSPVSLINWENKFNLG